MVLDPPTKGTEGTEWCTDSVILKKQKEKKRIHTHECF